MTLRNCFLLVLSIALTPPATAVAQVQASFVSFQPPPGVMTPGQVASVSVTMQNTGSVAWDDQFRLGSQSPENNQIFGDGRVYLNGAVVYPGQQHTFVFQATAPSTPGTYVWQWRMVQEWVQWFGDWTPTIYVQVQASQEPTSCPAANPDDYYPDDAALNACLAQGGTVTLKPNHTPGYLLSSGLVLNTSNTTIDSNGWGGYVKFKAEIDLDAQMLLVNPGVSGFTLRNLSFGTLPRPVNHRMLDSPALRKKWPCESPGSRKVRSSAS